MYNFVFISLLCLCFYTKIASFLTTGYTGKYWPISKDLLANEDAALAVLIFS